MNTAYEEITLALPIDLYNKLEKIAKTKNITVSKLCELILTAYINKEVQDERV